MLWAILIGLVVLLGVLLYYWIIYREKIRQAKLRKLLKALLVGLNTVGIKYWVDYGTLLGLYREGDIIRHDTDVDVCLYPRAENERLAEKMISLMDLLGSDFELRYYPKDHGLNLYRIFSSGVYADFYETVLVNGSYVDISGSLPSDLLGSGSIMDWSGLDVHVPENVPDVLSWRYGRDYMRPKRGVSNLK
jgi:hypothetical protein